MIHQRSWYWLLVVPISMGLTTAGAGAVVDPDTLPSGTTPDATTSISNAYSGVHLDSRGSNVNAQSDNAFSRDPSPATMAPTGSRAFGYQSPSGFATIFAGPPGGTGTEFAVLVATFDTTQESVSLLFDNSTTGQQVILTAFDTGGGVIDTDTSVADSGMLVVNSPLGIKSIEATTGSTTNTAVFDQLAFPAIPEPGALALLGLGAALMGWPRRRAADRD